MTPAHLRLVSFLEGLSFIVLGVAIYIRHVNVDYAYLVRYAGMMHGALFLAFLALLLVVCQRQKWGIGVFLFGLIAAFVPFLPFVFERYVAKADKS